MAEGSAKDEFFMYIYDLPYLERRNLCGILDVHNKWEELGGIYMKYDVETLNRLGQAVLRNQSPSNELLTLWQTQNHTVLELFVLLSSMKHYQAMKAIKDLVNPKYHRLLYEGEGFLGSRTFNQNGNMPPSAPTGSSSTSENAAPQDEKPMEYGINLMKDASDNKFSKVLKDSFCIPDATSEESKVDNNSPSKLQGMTASANNSYYAGAAAANSGAAAAALRPSAASPMKELNSALKESNITSRRKSPDASSLSSSAEAFTPQISYKELEAATNNWDKSQILGKGGFGTVYRGTWKNTQVAIKRLMLQDALAEELVETQRQQSSKELKYLSSFRHDNILPLYGYSAGGEAPCLVYQFLPNGSLDDRLRCRNNTRPLVWVQRLNIAIGTARGLNYLHSISAKPLIHGDIKSANILLDQNFEPKIGDFGLAREGPMQHYTHMKVSKVYGTRPYLPAEFLRNRQFSVKVDTFSFGVVLFEIATGLRAYDDHREPKYLYDHVTEYGEDALHMLVDARADADTSHTATGLMQLGKCCVHNTSRLRPDMATVLDKLKVLSVERNKLHKANMMARHNSLQPTTPIELQIAHDHSQQRRLSVPNPPIVRQQLHLAQAQPVLTNNQQTLSPQISVTPPSNLNSAASSINRATYDAAASSINRATSDVAASSINRATSGVAASSINRATSGAAASGMNRATSDAAASSMNRATYDAAASSMNRAAIDATASAAVSSMNRATSGAAASSMNRTPSPITASSNINNNSTSNSNYLPRVLPSFQEENYNAQTTASTSTCDDIPLLSALGMK